jgi:hypothetical protein
VSTTITFHFSRLPDGSNSIPEPSHPIPPFHRPRFHFSRPRGAAKTIAASSRLFPSFHERMYHFSRLRGAAKTIPPPHIEVAAQNLEKITNFVASQRRKNDCDTVSSVPVVSRAMILFFLPSRLYKSRSRRSYACSRRFTCSDPLRHGFAASENRFRITRSGPAF